jgi:hypothetical protein
MMQYEIEGRDGAAAVASHGDMSDPKMLKKC